MASILAKGVEQCVAQDKARVVRPVAFLCSGLMAFAYWMSHGTKAILPIENRGELAALYCFLFLFISAYGPGICSVDGRKGTDRTS